jgi:hypothetical protein
VVVEDMGADGPDEEMDKVDVVEFDAWETGREALALLKLGIGPPSDDGVAVKIEIEAGPAISVELDPVPMPVWSGLVLEDRVFKTWLEVGDEVPLSSCETLETELGVSNADGETVTPFSDEVGPGAEIGAGKLVAVDEFAVVDIKVRCVSDGGKVMLPETEVVPRNVWSEDSGAVVLPVGVSELLFELKIL